MLYAPEPPAGKSRYRREAANGTLELEDLTLVQWVTCCHCVIAKR